MANFPKLKPTAWTSGDIPGATTFQKIDDQLVKCINAAEGSVHTPTAPIEVGGAGVQAVNTLNRLGTFTFSGTTGSVDINANRAHTYIVPPGSGVTYTLTNHALLPVGTKLTFIYPTGILNSVVNIVLNGQLYTLNPFLSGSQYDVRFLETSVLELLKTASGFVVLRGKGPSPTTSQNRVVGDLLVDNLISTANMSASTNISSPTFLLPSTSTARETVAYTHRNTGHFSYLVAGEYCWSQQLTSSTTFLTFPFKIPPQSTFLGIRVLVRGTSHVNENNWTRPTFRVLRETSALNTPLVFQTFTDNAALGTGTGQYGSASVRQLDFLFTVPVSIGPVGSPYAMFLEITGETGSQANLGYKIGTPLFLYEFIDVVAK